MLATTPLHVLTLDIVAFTLYQRYPFTDVYLVCAVSTVLVEVIAPLGPGVTVGNQGW